MDYKELLKKYISWVGHQEGVYFIDDVMNGFTFTEEEVLELNKIVKELQ